VEISIGLFVIFSFYLISPVAEGLASALQPSLDYVEGLRPVVVVGCILLLLPPCTLIGGALPLMFRCFIAPSPTLGQRIGIVYGLNTLGASVGIFAVPLAFLNHLSLPQILTLAGTVNIGLGLLLLWLRPKSGTGGWILVHTENPFAGKKWTRFALGLAFVSGFAAIGFEISLFHAFEIVNPSSPYNFPRVIALFFLALALGSIAFTRGVPSSRDAILTRVSVLLVSSAVAMFICIMIFSYWIPALLTFNDPLRPLFVILFAVVVVMPVPILTGAIFPLLVRLTTSGASHLSETSGKIYLVNSLGAFTGALLGKLSAVR
jgi:spermidine synthase